MANYGSLRSAKKALGQCDIQSKGHLNITLTFSICRIIWAQLLRNKLVTHGFCLHSRQPLAAFKIGPPLRVECQCCCTSRRSPLNCCIWSRNRMQLQQHFRGQCGVSTICNYVSNPLFKDSVARGWAIVPRYSSYPGSLRQNAVLVHLETNL